MITAIVLANFLLERRLDRYAEKRFANLISSIDYHFIISFYHDTMYKKNSTQSYSRLSTFI